MLIYEIYNEDTGEVIYSSPVWNEYVVTLSFVGKPPGKYSKREVFRDEVEIDES